MAEGIWRKIRNAWSKISALILLFTAAAGISYEILHKIGAEHLTDRIAHPQEVLIILVSLLCGGLGAERLLVLGDIEESIRAADSQRATIIATIQEVAREVGVVESFEKDLAKSVHGLSKASLLIGKDDIESEACRLVNSCGDNDKIRATSQYFAGEKDSSESEDPLSASYYNTIAERLKRARPGSSLEYQVILPAYPIASKGKFPESARQCFHDPAIAKRISTLYARGSWPFELLIGGKSMIIAFPGNTNRPTYEMAIVVTDDLFVQKANEWFLEVVKRDTQNQLESSNPGNMQGKTKKP